MNGFQVYKYYLGTKLHFSDIKYDVIEMNCRVSAGQTAYNKRRDKWMFEKLAAQITEPRYLIRYLVANFAYGHSNVLYDREVGQDMESKWIKNKESMSRIFQVDLERISEIPFLQSEDLSNAIFKLYKSELISLETTNLIYQFYPTFFDKIFESHEYKLVHQRDIILIKKVTPFIKKTDNVLRVFSEFCSDQNAIASCFEHTQFCDNAGIV